METDLISDLSVHMKKTGAPLVVREPRKTPLVVEEWAADVDKKKSEYLLAVTRAC